MKRTFFSILACALSCCMLMLMFAACSKDNNGNNNGNNNDGTTNDIETTSSSDNNDNGNVVVPPAHTTHEYNKQKPYANRIAVQATCTTPATYYYSCSCGEVGTQTFEWGDAVSCKFENGACKWCGKAEPAETEGLIFSPIKNGEEYTVTGYEGTATEVYIPSTHNGKPVTSISSYGFRKNKAITSVIVGDNVTHIYNDIFSECTSLKTVVLGRSVTNLGEFAFAWCEALESVEMPDTLTSIANSAFWMCSNLKSVKIPYGVTNIEESAFGRCDSLTTVLIPDSVTTIGKKAFSWCLKLENIEVDEDNPNYSSLDGNLYNRDKTTLIQYAMGKTNSDFAIPSSVTTIGYYSFAYCENIVNLEIPNSVTNVEFYAFGEVSGLKYNTKDGLCYLGNSDNPYLYLADTETATITTATIDDNCRFIGDFAFNFCMYLTEVNIGSNSKLTRIGHNAFFYCGAFESITIPTGVTKLDAPFYACTSLKNITFANTENWYITDVIDDFESKTGGTAVNVADSAANATNFLETYVYHYWYKSNP